jgi:chloramphenicol 3-O phosphotransferase
MGLEPVVVRLYRAMHEAIAAHSHLGSTSWWMSATTTSTPCRGGFCPIVRGGAAGCALFVGVRCLIEVVLDRRRATWGGDNADTGAVPRPVLMWQQAVHSRPRSGRVG